MDKIEVFQSRSQIFPLIFVCLLFVLGGLWLVLSGERSVSLSGWFPMFFFGIYSYVLIKRVVDKRPWIKLDDNGIYYRNYELTIPWQDVEGAYYVTSFGTPYICLKLKDYDKYLAKLPRNRPAIESAPLNNTLGLTPMSLRVWLTDVKPTEIVDFITKHSQAQTN